ncbi:MAG: glycoside hydrolase [Bacteroidota bacterium]
MIKKTIVTTLLIGCFAVCMAMVLDITGKWIGTLTISDGTALNLVYTLKEDGDKVTGTAASQEGEINIENGQIKGSEISFTVYRNGEDVKHNGTVYKDSIGMNIESPSFKYHVLLKKEVK